MISLQWRDPHFGWEKQGRTCELGVELAWVATLAMTVRTWGHLLCWNIALAACLRAAADSAHIAVWPLWMFPRGGE